MTLSVYQKICIQRMRQGENLAHFVMHIKTIKVLEKHKLIEVVDGQFQLTDEGEEIKID